MLLRNVPNRTWLQVWIISFWHEVLGFVEKISTSFSFSKNFQRVLIWQKTFNQFWFVKKLSISFGLSKNIQQVFVCWKKFQRVELRKKEEEWVTHEAVAIWLRKRRWPTPQMLLDLLISLRKIESIQSWIKIIIIGKVHRSNH